MSQHYNLNDFAQKFEENSIWLHLAGAFELEDKLKMKLMKFYLYAKLDTSETLAPAAGKYLTSNYKQRLLASFTIYPSQN